MKTVIDYKEDWLFGICIHKKFKARVLEQNNFIISSTDIIKNPQFYRNLIENDFLLFWVRYENI